MNIANNILTSEIALSRLEKHLKVEFMNKNLLKRAFIHSSFKNENPSMNLNDNQELEFLGDAILGLVISEYIYDSYKSKMLFIRETLTPPSDEGKYSKFRDKHIGKLLSEIADKLELDNYLLKSNGESNNNGGKASRLEDLLEALIGAIFKDKGYSYTRNYVLNLFEPYLEDSFKEMYENELHALNKELENISGYSFLLTEKGKILTELNRFEEALNSLNNALVINPNNEEALAFKVYCLDELGEYEEGLLTANKLITLNPTFGFIWSDKGNMLLNLGRIDEALDAYKKSIELEPRDPDALYNIAKIYSSKENKKDTLFYLKKAVDLNNLDEKNGIDTFFKKEDIKNDKRFCWLLNDKKFKEIIEDN